MLFKAMLQNGGGDKPTASESTVEKDKSIEVDDVDGQNDKSIEDDELQGQYNKTIDVENTESVEDCDVDCVNDKGIEGGEVEGEDDDMEIENNKSVEDDDVEDENKHDKGVYVCVEDDESNSQSGSNFDWEADIWKEMSIGLESSKIIMMCYTFIIMRIIMFMQHHHHNIKLDFLFVYVRMCIFHLIKIQVKMDKSHHSYILKEDIGYACRVCGLIQSSIESIIEFQRPKV
ncbi:hypothetical protein L1987_17770 [Smallanthus sonchifolius]|uniref:Uncharacterized protein n=1 Tax=Smallanthus sonchifolius TaxID=185202 RepID=A0ACB9IZX4_9ASTR|nr:hypothetical protein L1987_17770 [Smallanthus sonchifolius]